MAAKAGKVRRRFLFWARDEKEEEERFSMVLIAAAVFLMFAVTVARKML